MKRENIWVADIKGVVYKGRKELMDPYKEPFAQETDGAHTRRDHAGRGHLSRPLRRRHRQSRDGRRHGAETARVRARQSQSRNRCRTDVKAVRPDAIIASGRSDYPNQINNVLCFPFIFRGALDVGATTINEAMKRAAAVALAGIADRETSDIVTSAYGADTFVFGPEYILPKPFDPRLIIEISTAVAKAAMDTGVATRPITDFYAYQQKLSGFVYRSGFVMKPVFEQARQSHRSA